MYSPSSIQSKYVFLVKMSLMILFLIMIFSGEGCRRDSKCGIVKSELHTNPRNGKNLPRFAAATIFRLLIFFFLLL
ncbi:hypothetical protein L6452_16967 [Arctium lappa]|uniref:Uncharacterized protein n=1 Tax=Arctium lappa TaxID=4217 RepID=A0ACB9C258_ARCLA|nr:hypothetical protein L6452_16967 [Arctium lappa]